MASIKNENDKNAVPSDGPGFSSDNKDAVKKLDEAPRGISGAVINLISKEVAERYEMMAFEETDEFLKVAMIDPENVEALNILSDALREAIDSFKEDKVLEISVDERSKKGKKETENLKDAPVAKLVEVIISHAVEGKASDIHIEPMEKEYRVRFRVDGILHVSLVFPMELGPAVVSRIKILANLKIDEKRKPQDGRIRLIFNKKEIDFRVSSLPVVEGEKIVMRILDKEGGVGDVKSLGLAGKALDDMSSAIQESFGMILVTGPTGSGKSTTLYALLKILNNEGRNIVTLEDPVEYFIPGMNQSQIKPEIGYTFASGLRTILRQDPNIIMVGEIRDSETAELAVHAALTGHLVLSTLHTNTATGAIPRLIDMGIEPFLLSSSLRMVVAQRLVRRICEKCKEERVVPEVVKERILKKIENVPEKELEKHGIDLEKGVHFYAGKGCDACGGLGMKGRVAIYEVIPVTESVKNLIVEKQGSEELIIKERNRMGVLTIDQDGVMKVLQGFTTIEEVERVTESSFILAEEND